MTVKVLANKVIKNHYSNDTGDSVDNYNNHVNQYVHNDKDTTEAMESEKNLSEV